MNSYFTLKWGYFFFRVYKNVIILKVCNKWLSSSCFCIWRFIWVIWGGDSKVWSREDGRWSSCGWCCYGGSYVEGGEGFFWWGNWGWEEVKRRCREVVGGIENYVWKVYSRKRSWEGFFFEGSGDCWSLEKFFVWDIVKSWWVIVIFICFLSGSFLWEREIW